MADERPNGRPPLKRGDPSVNVSVRLPGSQYDALDRRAQQQRVNVSELIRRTLRRQLEDDDDD
jgi:Arc/MetJ-type ribon-helix-helix transcriptional regulator